MDMLKTAHEYVQSKRGAWRSFAKEHGIAYDWLTKFADGRIKDPGYSKVEKLYRLAQKEAWSVREETVNQ